MDAVIALLICAGCGVCKVLFSSKSNSKKTLVLYDEVRSFRREHKSHDDVYVSVKDTEKE